VSRRVGPTRRARARARSGGWCCSAARAQAEASQRRALELAERVWLAVSVNDALGTLGLLELSLGNLAEAAAFYRRVPADGPAVELDGAVRDRTDEARERRQKRLHGRGAGLGQRRRAVLQSCVVAGEVTCAAIEPSARPRRRRHSGTAAAVLLGGCTRRRATAARRAQRRGPPAFSSPSWKPCLALPRRQSRLGWAVVRLRAQRSPRRSCALPARCERPLHGKSPRLVVTVRTVEAHLRRSTPSSDPLSHGLSQFA
jgi:hypothetical protein